MHSTVLGMAGVFFWKEEIFFVSCVKRAIVFSLVVHFRLSQTIIKHAMRPYSHGLEAYFSEHSNWKKPEYQTNKLVISIFYYLAMFLTAIFEMCMPCVPSHAVKEVN